MTPPDRQQMSAAYLPQVGADQPGARPEADQGGRAHPPRQRRLGGGQGEVAVDLGTAIRCLGPLAGQRRIRRAQLRNDGPGQEPQVRPQYPAGRPGQARRAGGEPLDHRRVQQHLRYRLQAQPCPVSGELPRGPQQVLGPVPAIRSRLPDDGAGEGGSRGRYRRRPPGGDVAGGLRHRQHGRSPRVHAVGIQ